MKKLITLISVAACLLVGFTTQAQSKLAHIDSQELLKAMPEMVQAQNEIQKLQDNYKASFEGVYKEYAAKIQGLQNLPPTTTQEEAQQKQQEIVELQQRIQEAEQSAGQEIQKKQAELTRPIFEKARAAINKVAQAQGFDFVLDESGGLLVVANGKDLLEDVKKELGI